MLTAEEYSQLPDDAEAALLRFLDLAVPRAKKEAYEEDQIERGDSYRPWANLGAALEGIMTEMGYENDLRLEPPIGSDGWSEWLTRLRIDVEKLHARLSFKLRRGGGSILDSTLAPVELAANFREEIRDHTRKIRAILNQAAISENLRHLLLDRLGTFERDLDRTRTRYDALFAFILDATQAVGDGAENLEPAITQAERIAGIMRKNGQLPQLTASQRKALPKPETESDLDDEVPF